MFNFFDEIKKASGSGEVIDNYQIINISGKVVYVEGHRGLTSLSKEEIAFKVKGGRVVIEGSELVLAELTDTTIKICGNIKKQEVI